MQSEKETLLTPHHVADITESLARHGISALVWGEMGALVAYSSRLVPVRLFLIVRNQDLPLSQRILTEELHLKPRDGFSVAERAALALSDGYIRYSLASPRSLVKQTPGRISKSYLQLFQASDVGLDDLAWQTACRGTLAPNAPTILVPDPAAFLQITTHLYSVVFLRRARYKPYEVTGAFDWLSYILLESIAARLTDLGPQNMTVQNATLATLICRGVAPSVTELEHLFNKM